MNTETRKRLGADEVRRYAGDGYLKGFPVFSPGEVAALQAEYPRLAALLPPRKNINFVKT